MIASPPSAWADAERRFHLAYLEDPEPFPRSRVSVTWTTRRDSEGSLELFVVLESDPSRSMAFSIDLGGSTPLRPEGTSSGVLVGGFGTNAITCLEVDGQVLWPMLHPVERPASTSLVKGRPHLDDRWAVLSDWLRLWVAGLCVLVASLTAKAWGSAAGGLVILGVAALLMRHDLLKRRRSAKGEPAPSK